MTEAAIQIDGMSCQHCIMRIRKALEGLSGIKDITVEIGKAKVSFDESMIQNKDIESAIVKAGYKIRG